MPWRKLQLISSIAGIALTIALSFYLPERVATHFDIYGTPDRWASNLANTILFCALFVFFMLLFSVVGVLLRKLPASLINIPNREYWFHPDRRENSIKKVGTLMAVFGFFTNIFFAAVLLLTFYANRHNTPLPLTPMILMLGVYATFVIGWIIYLYRVFKKPA